MFSLSNKQRVGLLGVGKRKVLSAYSFNKITLRVLRYVLCISITHQGIVCMIKLINVS